MKFVRHHLAWTPNTTSNRNPSTSFGGEIFGRANRQKFPLNCLFNDSVNVSHNGRFMALRMFWTLSYEKY